MWNFKSFTVSHYYNPNDYCLLVEEFVPFVFIVLSCLLLFVTMFVLPWCFLLVVVVGFYFDLLQYEVYSLCFFPSSDFEGINPIFSLLVVNLNF